MLTIENLRKSFGGVSAMNGVNLHFAPGSLTAVIGPNGAGKTTLLETVVGLRRPDHGRVRLGDAVLTGLADNARVFSFLLDEAELPAEVRVSTLLRFAQKRQGVPAALAAMLTERLGLRPLLSARATELSRGERRRVALFDALCTTRPILVLDEPFGVFDPRQLLDILSLVQDRVAAGHALLLSVHQMADAEKLASRCLLLRQGRVVALGTLAELQQQASLPSASLETIFLSLLSERSDDAGA